MAEIRTDQIFEDIVETIHEPLLILDQDLRIVLSSRSFYEFFKVTPEETVGQLIYDLGNKQWNIPNLRELLETILPEKTSFDNYEVEHDFVTIGRRIMLLNARQIERVMGQERIILLAIEDITERKKIEVGLEKTRKEMAIIKKTADEAHEFADSVINTVREPLIALDHDLRVVSVSRSFYDFFKVKPEETMGQLIYDLGNKQWDIPKLRELLETILPEKTTFDNYEVEHDFATIGKRTMLLNARQIKRAMGKELIILLAIEDITERKLSAVLLEESEERYRRLFETAADGILLLEKRKGNITHANPAITEMLGYTKGECIGKKLKEIGFTFAEDSIQNILQKLYKDGIINYEDVLLQTKVGKPFYADIYMVNRARLVQCNIRNITERKQAKEENIRLEVLYHQAQKMEAIGTLAGGIAHDFNNILSPIVGYAEIILMDTLEDSPDREGLNQIYTSALRAKSLVKQILTFSSQESSELMLMKMQPIVKEVLKLIRSTIPTTIEIIQDINPDCGVIKADPTQIHQILMNLATNAYHAMEDTGGELKVSLKQVKLGEYDIITPDMTPGIYACLTVADTGVGMDKNLTDKIFDPFFTTKATGKGTGMGLSVVHGIVISMGGTIHVYSEPGKGTQFNVYLPVGKSLPEEQVTNSKAEIQGGTEQILLVDDEEVIITMGKRMLEHLGYQVTSRTSSLEALEAFRKNPDKFNMVITDMQMPNMPGNKLSAELIKIRPGIPILICTGFSEIMSEEKAASLGIKGFIMKPVVMKDFAQKIREVLDKNE